MGPGVIAPGKNISWPSSGMPTPLQWGRERLLPERKARDRDDDTDFGFNGAGSDCSRKDLRGCIHGADCAASMGPGVIAPGKMIVSLGSKVYEFLLQWGRE